jgi:hypothetical protein
VPEESHSSDWRPVPDPTKLTTDAVNAVTEQYRRDMEALRELIQTRLSAMDKATELLAATVGRVPSETDKSISSMKELIDTRLKAMDKANELLALGMAGDLNSLKLFLLGEINNVRSVSLEKFTAIEGTFASNALALTAALAAQKEAAAEQNKSNTLAINKSEQATKEASLANVAQTTSSLASISATIADLKDRLVRLEAGGTAVSAARVESREARGASLAESGQRLLWLGVAISVVVIVANVVVAVILHH